MSLNALNTLSIMHGKAGGNVPAVSRAHTAVHPRTHNQVVDSTMMPGLHPTMKYVNRELVSSCHKTVVLVMMAVLRPCGSGPMGMRRINRLYYRRDSVLHALSYQLSHKQGCSQD